MTQEQPNTKFFRISGQSSIIILGGIILILWLIATPPGLWGKADAVGYAVCHRIAIRSFHLESKQLPLCARCTGQYLGAIIGLSYLGVFSKRRSGFPSKPVIAILILFVLMYAVDGLNSYLYLAPFIKMFPGMPHLYQPSNVLRLFTGTGMGLVIAVILYPAFIGSIVTNPDPRPALRGLKSLFILMGLGVLVDLLILTGSEYVLYPAALISASGVVLLLTLAYTTIWIRIINKENKYARLSEMILPLACGFSVTLTQIALFDLIRFIITGTWNGLIFG